MTSIIGLVPAAARRPIFVRLALAIRHCAAFDRRTMPASTNCLATVSFQRCIWSTMYYKSTPFESAITLDKVQYKRSGSGQIFSAPTHAFAILIEVTLYIV